MELVRHSSRLSGSPISCSIIIRPERKFMIVEVAVAVPAGIAGLIRSLKVSITAATVITT